MTTLGPLSGSTADPDSPRLNQGEVNLDNAHIETVRGENIHVSQSSVEEVIAETVEMHESSVHMVDASSFSAQDSLVSQVHSESLTLSEGAIGMAFVQDAAITGNVGAMVADTATFNQSRAAFLVTRELHGDHIKSGLILAGHIDGPVETTFTSRQALIYGAAAGMGMGIMIGLFKLFISRKS